MLRAIWLILQNEARLFARDPIVPLMLFLAPLIIIAVAGYSLGGLYGGAPDSYTLPLVDLDHGAVADGIIAALRQERSIALQVLEDQNEARRLVSQRERTPVAIEIPAGTSAALTSGHQPQLILFTDPVRQIEVNAIELRVGELCRRVTAQARIAAQKALDAYAADLRDKINDLTTQIAREQENVRSRLARSQAAIESSIRAQIDAAIKEARDSAEATIKARQAQAWADVQRQLSRREAILRRIQNYLTELQSSQRAFEQWLAQLKELAGSHASDIPPPPAFPHPIAASDLAELGQPIVPPKFDSTLPATSAISLKIQKKNILRDGDLKGTLEKFKSLQTPLLPGDLGFAAHSAIDGEPVAVNAFDQYVPGFGITFLLIGMMLGIALTLFDERDWGTLKRLQVSGVPLTGLLLGKLIARLIVGILQMTVLFAVGWALFGIALGREPLALFIPTLGISFASAALGLLIASISGAHDSVMPLGVTVSMAMAAMGGCWWPIDFEPYWMRELARWMPTTWTMQAFNDLMIRNQAPATALRPLAITTGLGVIFLVVGMICFVARRE